MAAAAGAKAPGIGTVFAFLWLSIPVASGGAVRSTLNRPSLVGETGWRKQHFLLPAPDKCCGNRRAKVANKP